MNGIFNDQENEWTGMEERETQKHQPSQGRPGIDVSWVPVTIEMWCRSKQPRRCSGQKDQTRQRACPTRHKGKQGAPSEAGTL